MGGKVTDMTKARKGRPVAKLSSIEAQRRINDIARDTSKVILSPHAKEQMAERDFINRDIYDILREGIVRIEAKKDKYGDWRYRVENIRHRGCRDAATVTIIKRGDFLEVVTVMWLD